MQPPKKRARRHRRRRPWSELPDDLLSVILDRLTPAFGDRVRFRGVCQAWRAAELAHPRPPMPWLVVPGHCISLHDASIHRVPLPENAADALCLGTFGHWLALLPSTSSGRPFLLNAFTKQRIKLPRRTEQPMVKFVLSSAPDSKNCTVAAIVESRSCSDHYISSKIVVCRVGRRGSWRTITWLFNVHDIIFFDGKLHAIDAQARVHVLQDGDLQTDVPWRPPQQEHIGRLFLFHATKLHLVVLHGKLHMVGRVMRTNRVPGCTHFTCAVRVFPLDETAKLPEPVKDLGGHAVFVGDSCCGAFPVSPRGSKIRENQIFFVDDEKKYLSSLAARDSRLFRLLLSYDVGNDCLRTYRPPESSSGTWRCVTAQRYPHASPMMGRQRRQALLEEELRLQDMANCLGTMVKPSYTIVQNPETESVEATVQIRIPKGAARFNDHVWSFTQSRPSAREARQAVAHEAATFLRSRFRSVFDDSPWSSVPHYHSHVDEDEEEVEKKVLDWGDCLFRSKYWLGW